MDSLIPAATGNPPKVAPGTNIATTVASDGSTVFVYYQDTTGGVLESQFDGRTWSGGASGPAICQAAPSTSLTAINWNNGNNRRVYYLDKQYVIQELRYDDGKWSPGVNFKSFPQASPHTSLAATHSHYAANNIPYSRIYYQTAGSLNIQELCYDDKNPVWTLGVALRPALDGTSIAAVAYIGKATDQTRVYCQSENLTLREHAWDGASPGWYEGATGFAPGAAPACTPIGTMGWDTNNVLTQLVHWMNTDRQFTQAAYSSQPQRWMYNDAIIGRPLPSYTKVAACHTDNGGPARLYYQVGDASILETQSDAGAGWSKGSYVQAG